MMAPIIVFYNNKSCLTEMMQTLSFFLNIDKKFPNLIVLKTQFMPATYSWEVAQHRLNLGGWKGMPLFHISMFCEVLFFCLFFCPLSRLNNFKGLSCFFGKTWPVQWWSTKLTLWADQTWSSLRFSLPPLMHFWNYIAGCTSELRRWDGHGFPIMGCCTV